jgi:hypothetical protein
VLDRRNVTHFDDAFWVTIPKYDKEITETPGYFEEINNRKKCCSVEVESVRSVYLVKTSIFPEKDYIELFQDKMFMSNATNVTDINTVVDAVFSTTLKSMNISIILINKETYGQLVNLKDFPDDKLHPELTRIFQNHDLWERR